jgi:hypothetical protein
VGNSKGNISTAKAELGYQGFGGGRWTQQPPGTSFFPDRQRSTYARIAVRYHIPSRVTVEASASTVEVPPKFLNSFVQLWDVTRMCVLKQGVKFLPTVQNMRSVWVVTSSCWPPPLHATREGTSVTRVRMKILGCLPWRHVTCVDLRA